MRDYMGYRLGSIGLLAALGGGSRGGRPVGSVPKRQKMNLA
jgi:hypothetical protein